MTDPSVLPAIPVTETPHLHELAPKHLREAMKIIPVEWQNYSSEQELEQFCYEGRRSDVIKNDRKLRASLWLEYEAAVEEKRQMRLINICRGVASEINFQIGILPDLKRVLYITTPFSDYRAQMFELLQRAIPRIDEMMQIPLQVNGKWDTKACEILLKVIDHITLRTKGSIQQVVKVDSRTQSVIAHVKAPNQPSSLEAINQLRMELTNQIQQLKSAGTTSEVEVLPPSQEGK